MSGVSLVNNLYGVLQFSYLEARWLQMRAQWSWHYPCLDSGASNFFITRFTILPRSPIPRSDAFCHGECGSVVVDFMQYFLHQLFHSKPVSVAALSDFNSFGNPISRLKSCNAWVAYDSLFISPTCIYSVFLPRNIWLHVFPSFVFIDGKNVSVWNSSFNIFSLRKGNRDL